MQLSENELIILKLMWRENRPLSRAEILKGTEGRNWNPASIHLILNSMISKGALKVTDETKKYGRTYEACVEIEDYALEAVKSLFPGMTVAEVFKIFAEACQKELSKKDREEITEILAKPVPRGRKKK